MTANRPFVLCIAGFDPSAGAGVLADIKTCEQNATYGLAVSSATTYQNDHQFLGLDWIKPEDMIKQLHALLPTYAIKAVKIGLIESLDSLSTIISMIKRAFPSAPIVWDPVIQASAGFVFHQNMNADVLTNVLNPIDLITPNSHEMDFLLKQTACSNPENFSKKYCPVLVKGGHHRCDATDVLWVEGKQLSYPGRRLGYDKHGTGCVLSSAIASYLALGNDINDAVVLAKKYVTSFISGNSSNLGYHS